MNNQSQGLASKRIEQLLDENSFVEIGAGMKSRSTDFNMNACETPGDGVVTGYGVINGSLVYVYSQDPAVLGGAIGEMHAKKIINLYDLAIKMGAPVIGLIDCAGLRLQESVDAMDAFGKIYAKQSQASGVIPQITAVFGNCGGGVSLFTNLSDFAFMEEKKANLFVNSPNALDGNNKEKLNTASAEYQSSVAGNVDFVCSEDDIYAGIRDLLSYLPANNQDGVEEIDNGDDVNRFVEAYYDMKEPVDFIKDVADNNTFVEVKKNFAKSMICGFARIGGNSVGIVANRENVLTVEGCDKASDFINECDAFGIPVVTISKVKGFEATVESEKKIARAAAKLTYAYASADVAKITLLVGDNYGSASVVMGSKSIGADLVFAWNDSKLSLIDSKSAVKIMYADELANKTDALGFIDEKAKEYDANVAGINSAVSRGQVDSVIEVERTRQYLVNAIDMLATKRVTVEFKKHGTV